MSRRSWLIFVIAGVLPAFAAHAQPAGAEEPLDDVAPELRPLVEAFYAVNSGDRESAQYLYQSIASGAYTTEQWQEVFAAFLSDTPISQVHTAFWDNAVATSQGRLQVTAATLAALFAVEAIVQPAKDGAVQSRVYDAVALPGSFLMYLANGFTVDRKGDIFDALWQRLGKSGVRALSSSLRSSLTPANYSSYIQFALLLAEYMPPGAEGFRRVGDLLGQPNHLREFWIGNAIFLFDEGGLTPAHVASLDSLFNTVPGNLHSVGAVIFPDSTGINPSQPFTTSVQLLYLPIIPMGSLTDPGEFLKHVGQPTAPAFTIGAAEQLMYAVQEQQFAANPSLPARRDLILQHAKGNYEAYMRRDHIVPVETYLENPDSLLPSVAVLWFIDSVRTLAIAKDLFQLSMNPAMDSVLLLADMLSGGGGVAPTFRTDHAGRVHGGSCQIARTHVTRVRVPRADRFNQGRMWQDTDLYLPSGIQIGRYTYQFELNDYGGTHRLLPLHD